MKVNVSEVFRDLDGRPLRADTSPQQVLALVSAAIAALPGESGEQLRAQLAAAAPEQTLRGVIMTVVGAGLKGMDPRELGEIYTIAARMPKTGEIDLDPAEITLLRRAVEKVYVSPLIVGQARVILDGKRIGTQEDSTT